MTDLANLRLKVFQNPMRDDGVFVAEDKPIDPYPESELSRELLGLRYPAVPEGHLIRCQLDRDLARRIVACVNHCAGKATEDL